MNKKIKKEQKKDEDKKKKKIIIIIIILLLLIIIAAVIGIWLLKNKEKNDETTSKMTEEVVYLEQTLVKPEIIGLQDKDEESEEVEEENKEDKTEDKNTSTNNKTSTNQSNKGSSSNVTATSNFINDVNSVKLKPVKTRREFVDNEVEKILNSIINDKMTNYEKLVAIYDYVIKNMSYNTAHNVYDLNVVSERYSGFDYYGGDLESVYWAENALIYKDGVCNTYAGFLEVLTRRVGFETYTMDGLSKEGSGHRWNVIWANENYYILDAQGDDNGSTSKNYFFGVLLKDGGTRYKTTYGITAFHNFEDIPKLYAILTIKDYTIKCSEQFLTNDDVGHLYIKKGETVKINMRKEGGTGNVLYSFNIRNDKDQFDQDVLVYEEPYQERNMEYTFSEAGVYTVSFSVLDSYTRAAAEINVIVEE